MFDHLLRDLEDSGRARRLWPQEHEEHLIAAAGVSGHHFANTREYRRNPMLKAYKAISIRHPWVEAIIRGYKTIECRPWFSLAYRGPLLIHASEGGTAAYRRAALSWIAERFGERVAGKLTLTKEQRTSGIVGVAHVVDYVAVTKERPALDPWWIAGMPGDGKPAALGYLKLAGVVPLLQPVPIKGKLGLFNAVLDPCYQARVDACIAASAGIARSK